MIPSGGGGEYSYGPTKDMLERVIPYLGMTHVRTILASGIGKKGAIENHPDILDSARQTGRDIAMAFIVDGMIKRGNGGSSGI